MKAIHENSTQAHREHEDTGKGATYRKRIVDLLTKTGSAMTDRQIIDTLHVTDVNNIRPEITRLKQAGVLEECYKVKCETTNHMVRTVKIR